MYIFAFIFKPKDLYISAILGYPNMRIIKLNKGKLFLRDDEVLGFIEKKVTPTGNSAKVDVPRRYVGKRAYVVVCKK